MSEVLFSIVIPTCNRPDLLSICLDSVMISIQKLPEEKCEVIVTEDGSESAKTIIIENFSNVKWVKGPGKGPAANRNNGARHASGKWLIFTDDDCIPDPDWLRNYSKAIKENGGNCRAFEGSIYPERAFNSEWEECPANVTGGYFWSANIGIEKELFFKVGGFDENYPTADFEDIDLYYCVTKHTTVKFIPDAKVVHPVRKINFWKDLKKNKARAKILAYHALKHKEIPHYKNNLSIIKHTLKYYVKEFVKNLIRLRVVTAAKRLYFMLIGIPLLMIHLNRLNKNNI